MSQENEQPRRGFSALKFPLGYKEAASQWWSSLTPATAEHRILSFIPYLQQPPTQVADTAEPGIEKVTTQDDPYGPRQWHSHLVQLEGKNRAMNEFSVERVGENTEENLVMLHGYGAGLGFFYRNFEALSRERGWKIWALDMLGMGRSSRPPFKLHAKDPKDRITEAENWFIDALEEWRIKRGISQFTLLGHSLGGYMATAYALKYPGRLKKLILASPVGIPEDPLGVNSELPEPNTALGNEFTQDAEAITRSESRQKEVENKALHKQLSATKHVSSAESAEPKPRPRPKWLTTLWDANLISPFGLVRWAGPFGPKLISAWTTMRFSHLPPEQKQALHDYCYSIFRLPGSSEYALSVILAPGAYARNPLINRIGKVGRGQFDGKRETGLPVVFMYGDHDWMDVRGGYAAQKKLKEAQTEALSKASAEEKKAERGSSKVIIIGKSGHHLYLEGSDEFNDAIRKEMSDTARSQL